MDIACMSALVQWVNAARVGSSPIGSLKDLRDGHFLARLLRMIDPVKWQREEKSIYGRFTMVSKFIEEYYEPSLRLKGHYCLPTRHRINMTAITNDGAEQEIAKVLVVLLHAAVNGGVCGKQFMDAALTLSTDLQELLCKQLLDIDSYKRCGSSRRLDPASRRESTSKLIPCSPAAAADIRDDQPSSGFMEMERKDGPPAQQQQQHDKKESQRTPPSAAFGNMAALSPMSPFQAYFCDSPLVFEAVAGADSDKTPPVGSRRQPRRARAGGEDAVHKLRLSLADELTRREDVEDELREAERRQAELESQLSTLERRRREEAAALRSEIEELQAAKQQRDEEAARLSTAVEAEKQKNHELAADAARMQREMAELHAQLLTARSGEAEARSEQHHSAAALLSCRGELEEEKSKAAQLYAALCRSEAELSRRSCNDSIESSARNTPARGSPFTTDEDYATGEPLSVVLEQKLSEVEADLTECRQRLQEKEALLELLRSKDEQARADCALAQEQLQQRSVEAAAAADEREQLRAEASRLAAALAGAAAQEAHWHSEATAVRCDLDAAQSAVLHAGRQRDEATAGERLQQARCHELSLELADLTNRLAATDAENGSLLGRLNAAEREIGRMQGDVARAQAALDEANGARHEVEEAAARLRQSVSELEQRLCTAEASVTALRHERDSLSTVWSTRQAEITRLNAEVAHLKTELGTAEARFAAMQTERNDLSDRVAELGIEVARLAALLDEALCSRADAEREAAAFAESVERERRQWSAAELQLNEQLELKDAMLCTFKADRAALTDEVQRSRENTEHLLRASDEQTARAESERAAMLDRLSALEAGRSEALQVAEESVLSARAAGDEKAALERSLEEVRAERVSIARALAALEAQMTAVADERRALDEAAQGLRADVERLKSELDDTSTRLDTACTEKQSLLQNLDELRTAKDEAERLLADAAAAAASREARVHSQFESAMSQLSAERQADREQLQSELDSLRSSSAQLHSERDALLCALERASRERDVALRDQGQASSDHEAVLRDMENVSRQRDALLLDAETARREREALLCDKEQASTEFEALLRVQEQTSADRDVRLRELETAWGVRDALLCDLEQASKDRDSLLRDVEQASRDRDALLRDKEDASRQRDALLRDMEDVSRQRDALLRDAEQANTKRDALLKDMEQASRMHERMVARLADDASKAAADAKQERDSLCRTLSELAAEKDRATLAADESGCTAATALAERDQLRARLLELEADREHLTRLVDAAQRQAAVSDGTSRALLEDLTVARADLASGVARCLQLADERAALAARLHGAEAERDAAVDECNQLQCSACVAELLHAIEEEAESAVSAASVDPGAPMCGATERVPTDNSEGSSGDDGNRVLRVAEEVKANVEAVRTASRALEEKLCRSEAQQSSLLADNERLRAETAELRAELDACRRRAEQETKALMEQHEQVLGELEAKLAEAVQEKERRASEGPQPDMKLLPEAPSCQAQPSVGTPGMAEQVKTLQAKFNEAKKTVDTYRLYYVQKKELVAELTRQVDLLKRDKSTMSELLVSSQQDYLAMRQQCDALTQELTEYKENGRGSKARNTSAAIGDEDRRKSKPSNAGDRAGGLLSQSICSSMCGGSEVSICDTTNISRVDRFQSSCISRLNPSSFSFVTPVKVAACEDEPSPDPEFSDIGRIAELRRRNDLVQPHLRSAYAIELSSQQPRGGDASTALSSDTTTVTSAAAAAVIEKAAALASRRSIAPSSQGRSPRRRSMAAGPSPRAAKVRRDAENRKPTSPEARSLTGRRTSPRVAAIRKSGASLGPTHR